MSLLTRGTLEDLSDVDLVRTGVTVLEQSLKDLLLEANGYREAIEEGDVSLCDVGKFLLPFLVDDPDLQNEIVRRCDVKQLGATNE